MASLAVPGSVLLASSLPSWSSRNRLAFLSISLSLTITSLAAVREKLK